MSFLFLNFVLKVLFNLRKEFVMDFYHRLRVKNTKLKLVQEALSDAGVVLNKDYTIKYDKRNSCQVELNYGDNHPGVDVYKKCLNPLGFAIDSRKSYYMMMEDINRGRFDNFKNDAIENEKNEIKNCFKR